MESILCQRGLSPYYWHTSLIYGGETPKPMQLWTTAPRMHVVTTSKQCAQTGVQSSRSLNKRAIWINTKIFLVFYKVIQYKASETMGSVTRTGARPKHDCLDVVSSGNNSQNILIIICSLGAASGWRRSFHTLPFKVRHFVLHTFQFYLQCAFFADWWDFPLCSFCLWSW